MLAYSAVKTLYLGRECYRMVYAGRNSTESYNSFARLDFLEVLILGEHAVENLHSDGGFSRCWNLKWIFCRSRKPKTYKSDNFIFGYHDLFSEEQYMHTILFVPKGTKKLYAVHDGWEEFQHIVEYDEATFQWAVLLPQETGCSVKPTGTIKKVYHRPIWQDGFCVIAICALCNVLFFIAFYVRRRCNNF